MEGQWKKKAIPPLWDDRAAERGALGKERWFDPVGRFDGEGKSMALDLTVFTIQDPRSAPISIGSFQRRIH